MVAESTKVVVEVVKDVFTIIAIIIGAFWTYFNFFKGRTYRPRLELKLSGKILRGQEGTFLITKASLKNVGLSRVSIQQKGSGLTVSSYATNPSGQSLSSVNWNPLAAFPVFEQHAWIEPGETIEDQKLVTLPRSVQMATCLGLRLVCGGIEWNTSRIVEYGLDEAQLLDKVEEIVNKQMPGQGKSSRVET